MGRVVTKISSCQVNTTIRRGIKKLGISFGSIFPLFSNKSSWGPLSQQPGKIPGPRLLMTTLLNGVVTWAVDSYILHLNLPCTAYPSHLRIIGQGDYVDDNADSDDGDDAENDDCDGDGGDDDGCNGQ